MHFFPIRILASFFDQILDILVSIFILLLIGHLLVICLSVLLLLHHLLLLNCSSILFLCHLILLLVTLRCILNNVGVRIYLHLSVVRSIRNTVSRWWNIFAFVAKVKWLTHVHCFEVLCSIFINIVWLIPQYISCKIMQ